MTQRPPVPTAADFMQKHTHTLTPSTSLDDAVSYLLHHSISNAPVLSEEGHPPALLGFLSERDCLEHLSNQIFFGHPEMPLTVRQIMKKHPICVPPTADLFTLATVFYQQGFRHLPVVEGSHLIGIVSRRDVLRALHDYWKKYRDENLAERFPPDLHEVANLRFIMK